MASNVYTVVVVILLRPAAAVDAQRIKHLQRIRKTYDSAYERWLPHITLIPPFRLGRATQEESTDSMLPGWFVKKLDNLRRDLEYACGKHSKHHLSLTELGSFRLRAYENIHLRPNKETASQLFDLQHDIRRASVPHVPKEFQENRAWKPHVSLGQAYTPQDQTAIRTEAMRDCALGQGGIEIAVDQVEIMYKPTKYRGGYTVYQGVPIAT
ncbi:hypothetical protein MYAM1_002160 [Malassezia yamatoensis]|uniref:Uncharacterized protein n=1 Tax=Malassezia yamatoensis TaxID=253288 RepID=A0AAJ6CJ14_9BASI|nr:hypothetical protein MYAM1_002160 [Malassezia yamatoensis]